MLTGRLFSGYWLAFSFLLGEGDTAGQVKLELNSCVPSTVIFMC